MRRRPLVIMLVLLTALLAAGCSDDGDEVETGSGDGDTSSNSITNTTDGGSTATSAPGGGGTPTTAAGSGGGPTAGGEVEAELTITLTNADDPDAAPRTYTIRCRGGEATVEGNDAIDAPAACAALADPDVRKRLLDGADPQRACTQVYGGPEQAHIEGTIDGGTVATDVGRSDGCGIADYDELLAAILTR